MAMLSDGAERVGLEQGLAFGLMNLTWATGQALGDIGGARLGEAAGDEVAYLLLSASAASRLRSARSRSARQRPASHERAPARPAPRSQPASAADGVALHAARVRGGAQQRRPARARSR